MPFFWVVYAWDVNHNKIMFEGKLCEHDLPDILADIWWWHGIENIENFSVDYES